MQFLSSGFVILWVVSFILYYLVPKNRQWVVLSVTSALFYVIGTGGIPVGILFTGVSTWLCGMYLKDSFGKQGQALADCAEKEKKKSVKLGFERRRKRAQILSFVLNLGLLLATKYMVVLLPLLQRAGLTTLRSDAFFARVVMPLGVSFYTLTAIGYLVDVGREQCEAEENPIKLVLFLAYFPAVTQGPFNRYAKLKAEFERAHVFSYERTLFGLQRFVWGAFKKLVIADRISIFVGNVFGSDAETVPGAIFATAVVLYMLQLYADFSGYMDMALGVSETFDIVLPENFKRPYFSRSVAEFWRRWHITLGAWFKDYVMFSFVMSSPGRKIGKAAKKRWPDTGKYVTSVLGTMLVWFFTGIWHGRTMSYILWGVYYGVIMSVSLILEPSYAVWKEKLHIREGKIWNFVCMARTWLIVFLADVLIRSRSIAQAGAIYASFLTRFHIRSIFSKEITSYGLSKYDFLLLFIVLLIWLAVSVLEERGEDVRTYLGNRPVVVRWACYYGIVFLLLITGIYGGSYDTAVFMYQSF